MTKSKDKSENALEVYFVIIVKTGIIEQFHWTESDKIILNP